MLKAVGSSLLLAMLCSATPAIAADVAPANGAIERVVIMHLDGNLIIEPDGSVSQAQMKTTVAADLAPSLDQTLRRWRFRPVVVAGTARRVSTAMHLVLVGVPAGDGYKVHVDSVTFPDRNDPTKTRPDGEPPTISGRRLGPPKYPEEVQTNGVMGTVILAIRVTPEGGVGEMVAAQTLLYNKAEGGNSARRSANLLEKAALAAALNWTFNVPEAKTRSPSSLTVIVPVQFNLGFDLDQPGQWLSVLRPPAREISWQRRSGGGSIGLASASGNGVSPLAGGLQLEQDVSGMTLN